MRKKGSLYIILFIMLFLLSACRSTKSGTALVKNNVPLLLQLEQMQAMIPIEGDITAKLRMLAGVDGKSLSSKGSFSVDKGNGMRIGITAMGLFEIARLDISVDEACLINKIGKEYAMLSYSENGLLGQTGLNYNILESVLTNRPFSPDGTHFSDAVKHMDISADSAYITVFTGKTDKISYSFTFKKSTGELVKTEGIYNERVRVKCEYSDFEKLTSRTFPHSIHLVIEGLNNTIGLELELSNVKETAYNFSMSNVSSYKPIEFLRIIELLK